MTEKKKPGLCVAPHSVYIIESLIEAGKYLEAQNAADANEMFYAGKQKEMQALFLKAEKVKRGVAA